MKLASQSKHIHSRCEMALRFQKGLDTKTGL